MNDTIERAEAITKVCSKRKLRRHNASYTGGTDILSAYSKQRRQYADRGSYSDCFYRSIVAVTYMKFRKEERK